MNETPPPALLEVRGVSKVFPGVRALDGVDFTLQAGEIHALLGENGAGKSTLINVVTGVLRRDGGDVRLAGRSIEGIPVFVLQNPSGRNAHYPYRDLVAHYRALARYLERKKR